MSPATSAANFVLGPQHAGTLMTPEEFDAITEYDENYQYELVHGVLVVSSIPLEEERDPNEHLGFLLRLYRHQHPEGKALDATLPQDYVRTRSGRRIADRVLWAGLGRQPRTREDVPTIAVEFVSEGKRNRTRDYEDKRAEYLEVGVQEYWIVDRFARRLTVVRNDAAGPREIVVPESAVYTTPLLPGFELPLAELLAVADAWEQGRA